MMRNRLFSFSLRPFAVSFDPSRATEDLSACDAQAGAGRSGDGSLLKVSDRALTTDDDVIRRLSWQKAATRDKQNANARSEAKRSGLFVRDLSGATEDKVMRRLSWQRGLTLVELVIALAVSALIAGTIVAILTTGSRIFKVGGGRGIAFQEERVVLNRMAKEIQEATKIYLADTNKIAFYKRGYTLKAHASPPCPNPIPSGDEYKNYDIVVFGLTQTAQGNGYIYRQILHGCDPTNPTGAYLDKIQLTSPDINIDDLKFQYFNYMGQFPYEKLSPTPIIWTGSGYSPGEAIRKVPANIGPSTYPQNIWKELFWSEDPSPMPGTLGEDLNFQNRLLRVGANLNAGNYMIWWDDNFPAGAAESGSAPGGFGWGSIPNDIAYSGDKSYYIQADIFPNETATRQFTGAAPAGGGALPGSDLLLFQDPVQAGPFVLSKAPTADTDTPNGTQLEVTVSANVVNSGGTAVFSDCSGTVILQGTDPANTTISETLEYAGCGDTQITQQEFKTVTSITTTDFTNENPVPALTITNPNRKVWFFTSVYIDPNPAKPVKALMIKFRDSGSGAWFGAYWSRFKDKGSVDSWFPANVVEASVGTYRGTGREGFNRLYMGPLPKSGGWVTVGVPVAAPGVRLEGKSVDGQGFAIYGAQSKANFDKTTIGQWSPWIGATGSNDFYTGEQGGSGDLNPSKIKDEGGVNCETSSCAHYIQIRGKFSTPDAVSGPTLHDFTVDHGQGAQWLQTVYDEWISGTFVNTVPTADDVELFRTSKKDNLVPVEEGPIPASVTGTSYEAGTIWQKIRWTRGTDADPWAFPTRNYRREVTIVEQDGIFGRRNEPVVVDVTTKACAAADPSIIVATRNGTQKPYMYTQYLGGCNHRLTFLATVRPTSVNYYWIYYDGAGGPPTPPYTKLSFPAWPDGSGIIGHYFRYNAYKSEVPPPAGHGHKWFPSYGAGQGEFRGARLDTKVDTPTGTPFSSCSTVYSIPGYTGCGSDYFSVAWRGFVYVDTNGNWTWSYTHDDGARLTVNTTSSSHDLLTGAHTDSFATALSPGLYKVKFDWYEYTGGATARLQALGPAGSWASPQKTIPKDQWYPWWGGEFDEFFTLYGWNNSSSQPAPRNLSITVGSETGSGGITYSGSLYFKVRGANTRSGLSGATWSANFPLAYTLASNYATTSDQVIAAGQGNFRYVQFKSDLSDTADLADPAMTDPAFPDPVDGSPVLDSVDLYNASVAKWVSITSADDWEAGTPGTYTGGAPDTGNPSVTLIRKPNNVMLNSSLGNEMPKTPEKETISISKAYTYSGPIWDKIGWRIGNMFWYGGPRQCYKTITLSNINRDTDEIQGGVQQKTRINEPVDTPAITRTDCPGADTTPANCSEIKVTSGSGVEMPYQILSCTGTAVTLRLLASVGVSSSSTIYMFYGWNSVEGGAPPASPPSYRKVSTPAPGEIVWQPGQGLVGWYWHNAASNSSRIRHDSYWGMRVDKQVNWGPTSGDLFGIGRSDYFSARHRGWIYLNTASGYNFQLCHDDWGQFIFDGTTRINNSGAGCNTWSNAPGKGFHYFELNMDDYVGNADFRLFGVGSQGEVATGTIIPQSSYYTRYWQNMTASAGGITQKVENPAFQDPFGRITVSVHGQNEGGAWSGWSCAGATPCVGAEIGPHQSVAGSPQIWTYDISLSYRFSQFRATLTGTDSLGNPSSSYTPVLSEIWIRRQPDAKWYEVGNTAFGQYAWSDIAKGYASSPANCDPGAGATGQNVDCITRSPELVKQLANAPVNAAIIADNTGYTGNGQMRYRFGSYPGDYPRSYRRINNGCATPTTFCQPAGNASTDFTDWGMTNEPFRRELVWTETSGVARTREPNVANLNIGTTAGGGNLAGTIRLRRKSDNASTPHWLWKQNWKYPDVGALTGNHVIMQLVTIGANGQYGPFYTYYGDTALGFSSWTYSKGSWDAFYGAYSAANRIWRLDYHSSSVGTSWAGRYQHYNIAWNAVSRTQTTEQEVLSPGDTGEPTHGQGDDWSEIFQFWIWVEDNPSKTYYFDHDDGIGKAVNQDNCNFSGTLTGTGLSIDPQTLSRGWNKMCLAHSEISGSAYIRMIRGGWLHDHDPSTRIVNWRHFTLENYTRLYGFGYGGPGNSVSAVNPTVSVEYGKRNWSLNLLDYGDVASYVSIEFTGVLNGNDYIRVYDNATGNMVWQRQGGGAFTVWTGWLGYNVNDLRVVYTWSGTNAPGARLVEYAYVPAQAGSRSTSSNNPAQAIDGSQLESSGYWRGTSATDPNANWWLVDLGEPAPGVKFNVAKWAFKVHSSLTGNVQFKVEVSEDLSAWKIVESAPGKFLTPKSSDCSGGQMPTGWSGKVFCDVFNPQQARYFKVTFFSDSVDNKPEIVEFQAWQAEYMSPSSYIHEQPKEPTDMTVDVKYLRVPAGDVRVHFSELFLSGVNDKVEIYDDGLGTLLASYTNGNANNMWDCAPAAGADPSGFWTGWLGSANLRVELHYNYTKMTKTCGSVYNAGYKIDQYESKPFARASSNGNYACKVVDGNPPGPSIDPKCDTLAPNYWSPAGGDTERWVEVDLGKVESVKKISVVNNWSPAEVSYYRVQISPDGENFYDWCVDDGSAATPLITCEAPVIDTWATGVNSGTYGSGGYVETAAAPAYAQYILITYKAASPAKLYEARIWTTPFLQPGDYTSEPIAPRKRADGIADGAIVPYNVDGRGLGTWDSALNRNTDWTFNNPTWAGAWVASFAGSGYYLGVLGDGTTNANINQGVWMGQMHLRYSSNNRFIHSFTDTTNGLFDAGVFDPKSIAGTSTDYSVARYLQATFRVSGATQHRWAFKTKDGYSGGWTWKYTNYVAVPDTNFNSYIWDMVDGKTYWAGNPAGATNWPWITLFNGTAAGTLTLTGAQPPVDVNLGNGDSTPPLQIQVTGGTDNTGTVKIQGVDATGASITEEVRYFEAGWQVTKKKFARVDTVTTTGFTDEATVPSILIRVLSFAGSVGQLALEPHTLGAGTDVIIDSVRVLPKTSIQKVVDQDNAIPGAVGSAFINAHFNEFDLQDDDLIQFWGKSTSGLYDVFLKQFDKSSLPTTGGWTGKLGWGYSDIRIRFIFNPNSDAVNNPNSWAIDKYMRSHRFYRSSAFNDDEPQYGAYCAGDGNDPDAPCARNAQGETYWKSKTVNPSNPVPNPWSASFQHGWYVDLWPDDIVPRPDYDPLTAGSQMPKINKVVLKWNSAPTGDIVIMVADDMLNWREVGIYKVIGPAFYFGAEDARYVGVFMVNPNESVELTEFEVYEAGPPVPLGYYLSQPFQAPSNANWVIPYPKDAYDIRLHFTGMDTQGNTTAPYNVYPFHDNLRIFNNTSGALLRRFYGFYDATGTSNLGGDSLLPNSSGPAQICNMSGGYRTEWLFAGNDAAVPSSIDPAKLGTRLRLTWTGALGYDPAVTGWQLDCYELYTAINPTLIQIDVEASKGGGRHKKHVSLGTRVQPVNLLLKE